MSDIFPQPKSVDSTLSEALGHYVYLLIDPRHGEVFYVGKGVGGRCFEHDYAEEGARKAARFAEIKAAGLEVKVDVVRHGMPTKEEAFLVESAVIDVYGIDPVQFGVIMVLNLIIGTITPPVGVVLFVVMRIADLSFEAMSRAILPWLLPLLTVLLAISMWPPLTLWLPRLLMG